MNKTVALVFFTLLALVGSAAGVREVFNCSNTLL